MKYSRADCEVIYPTAEAGTNFVIMQQNSDPKQMKSTTSTKKYTGTKEKIQCVQWYIQSQDLNLIEMLYWDIKRALQKPMSAKLNELKQHWKEEWVKIPPRAYERKIVLQKTTTESSCCFSQDYLLTEPQRDSDLSTVLLQISEPFSNNSYISHISHIQSFT